MGSVGCMLGIMWIMGIMGWATMAVTGIELTEEQYHQMPRLFKLDDMESCVANERGEYCLGSFTLSADDTNTSPLLHVMQKYSEDTIHHFNHTLLHRGYCISTRCASHAGAASKRFEACVDAAAKRNYNLRAKLYKLDYCTSAHAHSHTRPYDTPELVFAAVVAVILLFNVLGTVYDMFCTSDSKPNPYITAWSVRASWRRLMADHEKDGDGDPRLNALNPVQGVRAMTLWTVMMAHSVLGHYMSYIYNPEFFEKSHQHPLSMLIRNGTMVVQSFFVLSSFLLAYNVLMMEESKDTNRRKVSLKMVPLMILHRFIRIAPTHMLAVGLQATWWARASDGVLWDPLVGAEANVCRKKWWTHLLFINNLVYVDDMCLLPSWFLAADMQLYIVIVILTVLLAKRAQYALWIVGGLLVAAIGSNFMAAYHYGLQPMVKVISPEMMRADYVSHASFKWLYAAAWGSLPAALIGLGLAFLYTRLRAVNYPLQDNKVFCAIYRVFFALMVGWIMSGWWWQTLEHPAAVAAYAALERPVYAFGAALGMLGMFWGLDSIWRRACAASCWRTLGRLSLGVLLGHWGHSLGQLAMRRQPSPVSVYLIAGHLMTTMFMTYLTAMLMYLLVETPVQRFLHQLISVNKK